MLEPRLTRLMTNNLTLVTIIKLAYTPEALLLQNHIHSLTSFSLCDLPSFTIPSFSIAFTHPLTILLRRSKDANVRKPLLNWLSHQRGFRHRSPIHHQIHTGTRFGLRQRPWLGFTCPHHWRTRRNLLLRDELRERLQPSLRDRGLEKRRW